MIVAVFLACGQGRVTPAQTPPASGGGEPAVAAPVVAAALPELFAIKRVAFKFGSGITATSLPPELPAEVEVSVIPLVDLPPAVARTVPTRDGRRRISVIEHPTWKEWPTPPGRDAHGPFDLVVLYPAIPGAARADAATATGLPDTVTAATISAAIDRDGDGKADLVFTDWCCGEHTSPLTPACDAPCGELWSFEGGAWVLRERAGANSVSAP